MSGRRPKVAMTLWRRRLPTYLGSATALYTLGVEYVEALRAAGAIPVLLPDLSVEDVPAVLETVDALVLSGGEDVSPALYNGQPSGNGQPSADGGYDPDRDASEIALVRRARAIGMPVLGICRGLQVTNVACGGTLVADLPATSSHPRVVGPEAILGLRHAVDIAPDSRLAAVYDRTRREVNSIHHQAVDRLGAGLAAVARAADGVVEAVESTDDGWLFLGVQWHPEKLDGPGERELESRLFSSFVASVAAGMRR